MTTNTIGDQLNAAPKLDFPPLVTLSGIGKDFGDVTALQTLDLTIGDGEFLTLLGPSGCGKTTLLRILGGLEQPTRGQLTYGGADLTRVPPERRPFNLVFQNYALFPHMTVFDNVAYGLRVAGKPEAIVRTRVEEMLEMVDLTAMRDRLPRALSGGQQQRVALVRALINEPRLLLLDEPLGALDLQLRKRMQEELRNIQRRLGTTFVYVTHAQDEALALSHRVVLMLRGQIKQIGSPQEIYLQPRTQFVAEFIGDTSLLQCQLIQSDDRRAEVRLPNGKQAWFKHYLSEQPAPGEDALVSLRPDSLQITDAGSALLTGVVSDVVFRGTGFRYEVDIDGGLGVFIDCSGPAVTARGDRVGVSATPGGGVVVRADESAVSADDQPPGG
jgi:spermidine/putrescine transport system ATP-binding protein